MLVMIKAILCERTVVLCAHIEFREGLERSAPWVDSRPGGLGRGRKLWRQESVFKTVWKNYEKGLLREFSFD